MYKYTILLLIVVNQINCSEKKTDSNVGQQSGSAPNFVDGSSSDSGIYGSKVEIEDYLNKIDPLIKRYGEIQAEIYSVMGSSGVFTGSNLGRKTKEQKPALLDVSSKLNTIVPPPLISPFHDDFKHLLALRIDAFDAAIRAHEMENTSGDTSAFEDVTEKFALSDKQIVKLNDQIKKITDTLTPNSEKQKIASP